MEVCIYCGEPRKEKIGCCGENHFEDKDEELLDIPDFLRDKQNLSDERNVCAFCDEKRPKVAGPTDPRPYVCLKHRDLAHKKWPQFYA